MTKRTLAAIGITGMTITAIIVGAAQAVKHFPLKRKDAEHEALRAPSELNTDNYKSSESSGMKPTSATSYCSQIIYWQLHEKIQLLLGYALLAIGGGKKIDYRI